MTSFNILAVCICVDTDFVRPFTVRSKLCGYIVAHKPVPAECINVHSFVSIRKFNECDSACSRIKGTPVSHFTASSFQLHTGHISSALHFLLHRRKMKRGCVHALHTDFPFPFVRSLCDFMAYSNQITHQRSQLSERPTGAPIIVRRFIHD